MFLSQCSPILSENVPETSFSQVSREARKSANTPHKSNSGHQCWSPTGVDEGDDEGWNDTTRDEDHEEWGLLLRAIFDAWYDEFEGMFGTSWESPEKDDLLGQHAWKFDSFRRVSYIQSHGFNSKLTFYTFVHALRRFDLPFFLCGLLALFWKQHCFSTSFFIAAMQEKNLWQNILSSCDMFLSTETYVILFLYFAKCWAPRRWECFFTIEFLLFSRRSTSTDL